MSHLTFKGKEFVLNHHLSVPHRPIEPVSGKSVGTPNLAGNLIIQGDNLYALKSLLPIYGGKVDCIYIDPPYNTGNEGWCYSDNGKSEVTQAWMNDNPVGIEDGLRHDKWCAMMWPRLKVLKDLLHDEGVIFVSIDDNEMHRLRMMMDEIWGEDLFVGNIAWESKTKSQNTKDSFSKMQPKVEYILCYSKGQGTRFRLVKMDERKYPEQDDRGVFRFAEVEQMSLRGIRGRKSMVFPILGIAPREGKQWKIGRATVKKLEEMGDVVIKDSKPFRKMRPDQERGDITVPFWAFFSKEIGTAESAKKELDHILPGNPFETVKPLEMIRRILFHATSAESIVLDSFAGSGTTAHATLMLNKEDGGNRKFLLVECEDYADSLTAERVRKVIASERNKPGVFSEMSSFEFTYCTLGEPIDLDKILTGERLPKFGDLGSLLFRIATGEVIDASNINEKTGYLGASKRYHVWLLYKPTLSFLRSDEGALTIDIARDMAESRRDARRHLVFAPLAHVTRSSLDNPIRGNPIPVDYQPLPWSLYMVGQS